MRDHFGVTTRALLVLLLCLSGPFVTAKAEQPRLGDSRPVGSDQPQHDRVSVVAEARPGVATSQRVPQAEKLPVSDFASDEVSQHWTTCLQCMSICSFQSWFHALVQFDPAVWFYALPALCSVLLQRYAL